MIKKHYIRVHQEKKLKTDAFFVVLDFADFAA